MATIGGKGGRWDQTNGVGAGEKWRHEIEYLGNALSWG